MDRTIIDRNNAAPAALRLAGAVVVLLLTVAPAAAGVGEFDSGAFANRSSAAAGSSVTRFSMVNNHVVVPVTFWNNGRIVTARMILDTGAATTTVYAGLASELNLGRNRLARVKTTSANGTETDALLTRVDLMEIGDRSLPNAEVVIMPLRSDIGVDGLLGNSFLRRFDFTIDYNNRLLRWHGR